MQGERLISFFDDEALVAKQKRIWGKPEKAAESLQNLQPYLNGEFYKRTRRGDKLKVVSLYLDPERLYYCKGAVGKTQKVSGVLDLTCVKLEIEKLEEIQLGGFKELKTLKSAHLLKLSRNGQSFHFVITDELQYKQWKKVLNYRMIQTTFHEEFIVTKMIGFTGVVFFSIKNYYFFYILNKSIHICNIK